MTSDTTPAQDLRSALEPFAALADAILSEAPSGAENIVLFSGCDGKARTISMDQLRAATAAHADAREADALRAEIADLKSSVVAFGAPWAVQYAKDFGLPANHIHATHYDILAKAGARMVDFIRHDPTAPTAPAALVEGEGK